MLKQGVKFNIGTGEDIRVYQDNWLPSLPPKSASGNHVNTTLRVSHLICSSGRLRVWNDDALMQHLSAEDMALAKFIYLAQHSSKDEEYWSYSRDGIYYVRSGYHLAMNLHGPSNLTLHGDPN